MTKKYDATWKSLSQYEVPEWFKNAKLGIFIHWGVYSVPGFGCWYGHGMYNPKYTCVSSGLDGKIDYFNHHIDKYGVQEKFGYKDLIKLFTASKFDPDEWCELVKQSGARYIIPVADFHDAFAMYDSDLTDFSAVKMGPKRNIINELKVSAAEYGLKFGVSSHLALNPFFFTKHPDFDNFGREYEKLYGPQVSMHFPDHPHDFLKCYVPKSFVEYWYERTVELIEKSQPDQLWFDLGFALPEYEPYRRRVAAYYYNKALEWGKEVVLTYKWETFPEGSAVLYLERASLEDIRCQAWQTDTSVGTKDWSYTSYEEYKPAASLIRDFIDIVSKNGCLLLNIGPHPDGSIPEKQKEILLQFGKWLNINGEAIYDTRPWIKYGEGPMKIGGSDVTNSKKEFTVEDIRFTTKGNTLYAIFLRWPGSGMKQIKSLNHNALLGRSVKNVELLGYGSIFYQQTEFGFFVKMPYECPCEHAVTIKITSG